MKVFNLRTTGKVQLKIDAEEFVTEIDDPKFSTGHQTALSELVASLQEQGVQELHVEKDQYKSFVHKIKSDGVLSSNDTDAYPIFTNLQEYVNDLKVIVNSRHDTPMSWEELIASESGE